jgi:hypothetical protein
MSLLCRMPLLAFGFDHAFHYFSRDAEITGWMIIAASLLSLSIKMANSYVS